MYDFIIFEHSRLRNHLVDLIAIGKMLKDSGYNVAIVDLEYGSDIIYNSGIPAIEVSHKLKSFNKTKDYLKAIAEELSPLADNFYVGSVLSDTSIDWLKFFPSGKRLFVWGLRSFFFTYFKRLKFSRYYPGKFIQSLLNLYILRNNKNIRLFVSDEIIRDEFVELGVEPWRLVIRRERFCNGFHPAKEIRTATLKLLSIGALRPEKRIDLCIDAIEAINPPLNIEFVIAGKAYSIHGYDKMLLKRAVGNDSIQRIDRRLDEKEYNKLIHDCDFLLLCDERQPSCVTNGTMAEALLAGRPIIAPNYNPYKYIVEKYGVGLLYDLHDIRSIKEILKKAVASSPSDFVQGIMKYQEDFFYDRVINDFKQEMSHSLNR